ncbi:TsaC protein [Desulfocucumis palustris]|uniref:Threonylcarbamoyl-AMP synthase n=1 Tax=Desulfocucumis palustris TaxID=1898651 RepID=A0A2L2XHP8_9FIRM|nr:L-threonylcarbamoyladenylate synthase [Desulfocucumis palustris]GBF35652.1 TsaC protein [Desulfocucumis palustris]
MEKNIQTKYWVVDGKEPDPGIIRQAGEIIRNGGLVAFPTETVYGLGASALDDNAVEGIFRAKGRPQDNPLIVHVADMDRVWELVSGVPARAAGLMEKFWPGPLTVILRDGGVAAKKVTAGLDTLALRMPDHPVALALIRAAGVPVAAPSANLSGRPSPTTAEHVRNDLSGRLDAILDGGPAGLGVESTVVDLSGETPVLLRPGGITPGQIESVTGRILLDPSLEPGAVIPGKPRSPGMKYRHYAPAAPLVLVEGTPSRVTGIVRQMLEENLLRGKRVGVLCREENAGLYPGAAVVGAGAGGEPGETASKLYAALRRLDQLGVDLILAEGVEPRGVGLAVANRLRRAAGKIINTGQLHE